MKLNVQYSVRYRVQRFPGRHCSLNAAELASEWGHAKCLPRFIRGGMPVNLTRDQ